MGNTLELQSYVHLIHLNGNDADLEHSDCTVSSSNDSCTQLLHDVYQGLLNPSVELSAAAAKELQRAAQCTLSPDGILEILLESTNSSSKLPNIRAAPHCTTSVTTPAAAGSKVRSLPVELLYDDDGLTLFDQITYLPEYYLTAAEVNILATNGHDIVESCVRREGAMLVELGAGSMRKTGMLLDAVLATGRTDVTFCALDLCQDSLNEALQALQGLHQGRIKLVGLVGTYQQGLAHLQQQQQTPLGSYKNRNHITGVGNSSELKLSSNPAGFMPTPEPHLKLASMKRTASSSTTTTTTTSSGSTTDSLSERTPSYLSWEEELLLLQPPSVDGLTLYSSNSSSTLSDSLEGGSGAAGSIRSRSCSPAADDGVDETTPGQHCQFDEHGARSGSATAAAAAAAVPAAAGKVLMWLGSSIGNLSRGNAAVFLTQLKEAAMQPGDVLLVGIDRRNSPEKVQLAYNDPADVTRAFILNGLKHCKHLLDNQLQQPQAADDNSRPPSVTPAINSSSSSSSSSMNLDDFSYFCLYNEELGRHEAYYQAKRDTVIQLPGAAAGVTQFLPKAHAAAAAATAPAGGEEDGTEQNCAAMPQVGDTNSPTGSVAVRIAAGELIHIEYSHKYSRSEVDELAAIAGLKWVKAWTDSEQQYDLHMLAL